MSFSNERRGSRKMKFEQAVSTGRAESPDSDCLGAERCPVCQGHAHASDGLVRLPDVFHVFDHRTGCSDRWNRSLGALLGFAPLEVQGMGGEFLRQVVDPAHLDGLAGYLAGLRRLGPGERGEWDFMCHARDGRKVWLRSIVTALDVDECRHVGIATDITALKEAEPGTERMNRPHEASMAARIEALRLLNVELENRVANRTADNHEMLKELSELAHIATHNIKVPVANMCSLANTLLQARSDIPEAHHDTLDWLAEAGEQARATLDALVRVAVTRDAGVEPAQTLDLAHLVDRVLDSLSARIAAASARLSVDMRGAATVRFGQRTLESALRALIKNALTYAQEGRPLEIIIRVTRSGGEVRLSVADNGRGLDPERDRSKVFGLFKRAHASPPGQGVELYCSDMAMRRQGGSIEVSGRRGQGAIFTLLLPGSGDDPE
jgi:PAS domain S-box-containing protein